VIVKFVFDTSKKTLPTPSTFTRADEVEIVGIVTASEPSLSVLAARTSG
jgi:hypothetical protein